MTQTPPSRWVERWLHLVPPGGRVLDVACGSGRHLRLLVARGFAVTGVDRDAEVVAPLQPLGRIVVADIENGPWPLAGETFDAVLVTNYLWRPLWPALRAALAPAGLLICETFALGQAMHGRPSRPEFLLEAGELLQRAAGLHVLAYEDGELEHPRRRVQRIAALNAPSAQAGRSALYADGH